MHRSLECRRHAQIALVFPVTATVAVAFVAHPPSVWAIQMIADVLLVGYVAILIHVRNAAAEVQMARRVLGR